MKPAALASSFSFFRIFSNTASLSSIPWNTREMPSSFARSATAGERRPERIAAGTPLAASILMPWPSCASKTFSASPRGPYQSRPSVSTPSTSKIISLTPRARSSASGDANCMRRLDDPCAEQVVHVQRADQDAARVDDQHLVDLVLLHELHRLGGERARGDGARRGAHHRGDAARRHVAALLERAAQVAVGE